MKSFIHLIVSGLFIYSPAYGQVYSEVEGFENPEIYYDITGAEKTKYGIWFDGGSSAFPKTSERYDGDTSFAIAPLVTSGDGDKIVNGNYVDSTGEEKPYYGSIYSQNLDISSSSSATINFRYLITNSQGHEEPVVGYFAVEVSADGGETFNEIARPNGLAPIKSTKSQWTADNKLDCTPNIIDVISSGDFFTKCVADVLDKALDLESKDTSYLWSNEIQVSIPDEYLSANTIVRIKSYYDNAAEPKLKTYFDNLYISYEGESPIESGVTSLVPSNDTLPDNAVLYNHATFDGELNDGRVVDSSTHDWGIWADGGRNAYLTAFLAEGNDFNPKTSIETASTTLSSITTSSDVSLSQGNAGVALKWTYVEGLENDPAADGASTGEHKPTYSSIFTENTDFSIAVDLAVEFTFVGYNLDVSQEEFFELSISTNSGIDFYTVKQWVVGKDFINKDRNKVTVIIPGDITEAGRLTQTTQLKIQSHGDILEDHTYIDNVKVYTIGTGPGLTPANEKLDWASYESGLTVIKADTDHTPTDPTIHPAYDLINSALIKESVYLSGHGDFEGKYGEVTEGTLPCIYGAVEHTDDSHVEFGEHITQGFDATIGGDVFYFHIHQEDETPLTTSDRAYPSPDTDRCRTDAAPGEDSFRTDRQRMEIKAYSESYDHQLAVEGETHYMSWRMKLPAGYGASDKFTHLHQLKPKGGDNASMPTITLTPVAAKVGEDVGEVTTPAKLNLRYSPSTQSQVTLTSIDLADIEGKWVQIIEKVTYGGVNDGRYEFIIMNDGDLEGTPIMSFASDSLLTWKGGDFVRAKWGVYRSIAQGNLVKDEIIGFADFVILEITEESAKSGSLLNFGAFANEISAKSVINNESVVEIEDDLNTNDDFFNAISSEAYPVATINEQFTDGTNLLFYEANNPKGFRNYGNMFGFFTQVQEDDDPTRSFATWITELGYAQAGSQGVQDYLGFRLKNDSTGTLSDEVFDAMGDGVGRDFLNNFTVDQLNNGVGAADGILLNPEVLAHFPAEELLNLEANKSMTVSVQKALGIKIRLGDSDDITDVYTAVHGLDDFDNYLDKFSSEELDNLDEDVSHYFGLYDHDSVVTTPSGRRLDPIDALRIGRPGPLNVPSVADQVQGLPVRWNPTARNGAGHARDRHAADTTHTNVGRFYLPRTPENTIGANAAQTERLARDAWAAHLAYLYAGGQYINSGTRTDARGRISYIVNVQINGNSTDVNLGLRRNAMGQRIHPINGGVVNAGNPMTGIGVTDNFGRLTATHIVRFVFNHQGHLITAFPVNNIHARGEETLPDGEDPFDPSDVPLDCSIDDEPIETSDDCATEEEVDEYKEKLGAYELAIEEMETELEEESQSKWSGTLFASMMTILFLSSL